MLLSGSFILAFGLYNIHSQSGVTEGGVLGLILLLDHWFGLSPSISSLVMNAACYVLGLRVLGWSFIVRSGVASLSFSAFYAILECFPRLWTGIAEMPLLAAVVGAIFVGGGVGICVLAGGAPGGGRGRAAPHAPVRIFRAVSHAGSSPPSRIRRDAVLSA